MLIVVCLRRDFVRILLHTAAAAGTLNGTSKMYHRGSLSRDQLGLCVTRNPKRRRRP